MDARSNHVQEAVKEYNTDRQTTTACCGTVTSHKRAATTSKTEKYAFL